MNRFRRDDEAVEVVRWPAEGRSGDLANGAFDEIQTFGGFGGGEIERWQQPHDLAAGRDGQQARLVQAMDHLGGRRLLVACEGRHLFLGGQFNSQDHPQAARAAHHAGMSST